MEKHRIYSGSLASVYPHRKCPLSIGRELQRTAQQPGGPVALDVTKAARTTFS